MSEAVTTSMRSPGAAGSGYVFGHSPDELKRLEIQASWFAPITERLLRASGVGPGMRLLDVGTGVGDVAILAGELVGPLGQVLGIDRSPDAVDRARSRTPRRWSSVLSYQATTLAEFVDEAKFDAVVGRFVITHQADPVAFVRQAASMVRPGGILGFVEPAHDGQRTWSTPAVPAYDRACNLFIDAVRSAGVRPDQGLRLVELFAEAGVPEPSVMGELWIGGASSSMVELSCLTLASVRDQAGSGGVAVPVEADDGISAEGMRHAAENVHALLRNVALVGAWVRIE